MTGRDAREECVLDNLGWYRSITRAHGIVGAIEQGTWTCRARMPPYFSNAVTVDRLAVGAQLAHARALADEIPWPFTIKDSYGALDLGPLGFRVLFDAQWIRLAHDDVFRREDSPARWRRLTTPDELERWEDAWRAAGSPSTGPIFVPALLSDESVVILAGDRDGEIAAGVVVTRSAAVVGLSNFFAAAPDVDELFAAAVQAVRRVAPGAPIVGYEGGEALARALQERFRPVGRLRIWLREP